jgi:hypothetical protein
VRRNNVLDTGKHYFFLLMKDKNESKEIEMEMLNACPGTRYSILAFSAGTVGTVR